MVSNATQWVDDASKAENALLSMSTDDSVRSYLIKMSQVVLGTLARFPTVFETNCPETWAMLSEPFSRRLAEFVKDQALDDNFIKMATSLYAFLREFVFNKPQDSDEMRHVYSLSMLNLEIFTLDSRFAWAHFELPTLLVRRILKNPEIAALTETPEKAKQILSAISTWEKNINARIAEQDKLEQKVDKLKSELNFIALDEGFLTLATDKRKRLKNTYHWLTIIGLFAIALPVLEVLGIIYALIWRKWSPDAHAALFFAPPLIAIELLLLYGFRIVLQQYRALQAQLLQIDLRRSLCQFIENYAEYAKRIKANDSAALDKFESMIFSGITSSDEQLPSAFDGFERLMQAVRGSSTA